MRGHGTLLRRLPGLLAIGGPGQQQEHSEYGFLKVHEAKISPK
jgi:hypothetical protein